MQYVPRTVAFKARGRPPTPVAPALVEALQQTLLTGNAAVQDITAETPEMVAMLRTELRRAGRQLGFKVHIRCDGKSLAFYAEARSE